MRHLIGTLFKAFVSWGGVRDEDMFSVRSRPSNLPGRAPGERHCARDRAQAAGRLSGAEGVLPPRAGDQRRERTATDLIGASHCFPAAGWATR